jgi:hypothetical protein
MVGGSLKLISTMQLKYCCAESGVKHQTIQIQMMGVDLMTTERSGLYSRENYLFDFSIDICFNSHF